MTTQLTELQKQAVHYADIRKRLFYSKPKTAPVKMVTYIEPQKPVEWLPPKPEWKKADIHFDAHVIESRRILEMLKTGEIDIVKVSQRTVLQIVMETLERFPGITVDQVRGVTRCKPVVEARHHCMYEVKMQRQDLSFPAIGRWFGNRDHCSILSAYNKIAGRYGDKIAQDRHERKRDRMNGYRQNPCIPAQS